MKRWLLFLLMQGMALAAVAQDWPAKAIRIIVPFAPGGAGGIIGMQAGPQAQADGYTLLMATNAEIVMQLEDGK